MLKNVIESTLKNASNIFRIIINTDHEPGMHPGGGHAVLSSMPKPLRHVALRIL
jgi:hypothetical protein